MATTYQHIAQNKRRTWMLVLLFPIVFALLTALVLGGVMFFGGFTQPQTAPMVINGQVLSSTQVALIQAAITATGVAVICWILACIWMAFSYFSGDKLLLSSADAIPVTRQDQPEIYRLVENLCMSRRLPLPRIYIMDDESLNAFATGRDPEHASVALTKGIVKKLERAELEGVVAHELSHIENRDIRLMLITVAGISFFTFAGELCFRLGLSSSRGNRRSGAFLLILLGLVCWGYGLVFAPLIRLAMSRQREYLADATGALMTRNPAALASALRKISSDSRVEALDKRASMAAMCIENPLAKQNLFSWMTGLMATHPPIAKRIAALEEMDRGF
ncbi:MAG: M48 family metallopeptidase [Elusimicrobiaceae bacterium]|nr:M48 family metallopeptidase [Elusimicrobiaceae bacterium]